MIELKAALSGKSLTDFIRGATLNAKVNIPEKKECPYCKKEMEIVYENDVHEVTIADRPYQVIIKNVPYYKCTCGKELGNLHLGAELERAVEDEVLYCLNHQQPLPKEIDVKKLAGIS